MQLKKFVVLGLTTLALAAPFASHAESDFNYNREMYMKMADKGGMVSKADFMKMVEKDFDAMSKGGMMSVDKMQELLKKLYTGGRN